MLLTKSVIENYELIEIVRMEDQERLGVFCICQIQGQFVYRSSLIIAIVVRCQDSLIPIVFIREIAGLQLLSVAK